MHLTAVIEHSGKDVLRRRYLWAYQGSERIKSRALLGSRQCGRRVYAKTGDELVALVRKPGQLAFAWFIDLGQVIREIRERMAA